MPFSSLLRERDVKLFTAGRVISELGSHITREGLPIVAILAAGSSAAELGLLAAASSSAGVVVALWAGVLVDRRHRRPLLIASDLLRAALLLSIPAAALVHRLTFVHILLATALIGGTTAVFEVADQAWFPQFIQRRHLEEGAALVATASAIGESGGPALMGILVQLFTAPFAIIFDGLSYVTSAVSLMLIQRREPAQPPSSGRSGFQEAISGLRAMSTHPVLRPLLLFLATESLFAGAFEAVYELYALKVLHLTPFDLGLLITSGGLGALLGSVTMPAVRRRLGTGTVLAASALMAGLLDLLIPLAHGPFLIAFGFLFLAQVLGDFAGTLFEIGERVTRQSLVSDEWLGRVNGARQFLVSLASSAGALLFGIIATVTSARFTLTLSAAGQTLCDLWLIFSTARQLKEPAALPGEI